MCVKNLIGTVELRVLNTAMKFIDMVGIADALVNKPPIANHALFTFLSCIPGYNLAK